MNNKQGMQVANRFFLMQLAVALILATVFGLIYDMRSASSMLLGGLVSAVPNRYFAQVLFRHHGAQASKKIVNSFYKAEALKLVITFCLFGLIFKYYKVVPWIFFTGFIVTQMMFWFTPLILEHKRK